jgi:ribonuclease HI
MPARDQDHPGDPRGLVGDRGAADLSREEPPSFWGELAPTPRAANGPTAPAGPAFIIRTDGAARGNPGPASAGAVLIDAARPDSRDPFAAPDASISEFLGHQTNNVAEYTGVVRALALARELGARQVDLLIDSKLIVEQLAGRWRVKDAKLAPLHAEARRLLAGFARWTAVHVPRAQNGAADALANEAIDRVAAGGPAVVIRRPAG